MTQLHQLHFVGFGNVRFESIACWTKLLAVATDIARGGQVSRFYVVLTCGLVLAGVTTLMAGKETLSRLVNLLLYCISKR